MRYRFLGGTGLRVSELCLGTVGFGSSTPADEAERIYGHAIEAGINFFDTANADPTSEALLGSLARNRRQSLIVSTKVFRPTAAGPNDAGLSRKHIVQACEASLRRLQTDYIDLYLAHSDDFHTPLEETLSAFDLLVRQGKVLYVGASNYMAWRLNESLWIADTRHYSRYCCLQAMYNLHERDIEAELLPLCREKHIGVIAWSPLARGALTDSPRHDVYAGEAATARQRTYAQLRRVAAAVGKPMAQVSLRWILNRAGISCVAIGASTLRQLEENLGVVDLQLSPESIAALDAASARPLPYPANLTPLVRALRDPD